MPLPEIVSNNLDKIMLRPWAIALPALFARVTLGALLIYHGTNKVFGGLTGLANHLSGLGWPLATLQAVLASYTEFLGGIFLVVGLLTRLSAALNVGLFTIIVFVFHGSDAFSDKEAGLLYLLLSVVVLLSGPGKVSVDHFLFKKTEERGQA
jgi:putative oxidoreductase